MRTRLLCAACCPPKVVPFVSEGAWPSSGDASEAGLGGGMRMGPGHGDDPATNQIPCAGKGDTSEWIFTESFSLRMRALGNVRQ